MIERPLDELGPSRSSDEGAPVAFGVCARYDPPLAREWQSRAQSARGTWTTIDRAKTSQARARTQ